MKRTEPDEWEEIAEQTQRAYYELVELHDVLEGVPKKVWLEEYDQAKSGLSDLKSLLEQRMAAEHPPEEWDTDLFYGDDPRD